MTPQTSDREPRPTIYRCGWCGFPTDAEGKVLFTGSGDLSAADTYLANNAGAIEKLVNGECCPGGDEQGAPDRSRQVTREMAMDAQDPSLEGRWIEW